MRFAPELIQRGNADADKSSAAGALDHRDISNFRPTAIDLFAGAGGFSLGLASAGFEVLSAFDSWDVAIKTYSTNFDHPVVQCDLSKVTGQDLLARASLTASSIDILVGGPPCQGFSVQRIGSDQDARNHLVLEFGRLVSELQPRLFLMENVPGLLGKRGKELVAEFTSRLERAGYRVTSTIINAADYGVPQLRKRVVFAGWKIGQAPFEFPRPCVDPKAYRTVADALNGHL